MVALGMLAACASTGSTAGLLASEGENFAVSLVNQGKEKIENIYVWRIGLGRPIELYSAGWHDPTPISIDKYKGVGNNQYMSDNGSSVPEFVKVWWHKKSPLGEGPDFGKYSSGEKVGPFEIPVRSRIPKSALDIARRDGHSITIIFAVAGPEPVLLKWFLNRRPDRSAGEKTTVTVDSGGDF